MTMPRYENLFEGHAFQPVIATEFGKVSSSREMEIATYKAQEARKARQRAAYSNVGGGGEESSSSLASDHVDDYGNTPAPENGLNLKLPVAGTGGYTGQFDPNMGNYDVPLPPYIGNQAFQSAMMDRKWGSGPVKRDMGPWPWSRGWSDMGGQDLSIGKMPSVTMPVLPDVTKPFDDMMQMLMLMIVMKGN